MRVLRGRGSTPSADRRVTSGLVERVRETGEPGLRIWQPERQVTFGRRDTSREGYEAARSLLADREIPAVERSTGGHAVYFSGTTVSFVRATPVADFRNGVNERYEEAIDQVQSALGALGVETTAGEPSAAFCPGTHSLSADGKIVGLAQRVRRDVAVLAGIVIVEDCDEISAVLDPVYELLDIPFDPASTGSIARTGGVTDFSSVRQSLEDSLTDRAVTVEQISEKQFRET